MAIATEPARVAALLVPRTAVRPSRVRVLMTHEAKGSLSSFHGVRVCAGFCFQQRDEQVFVSYWET